MRELYGEDIIDIISNSFGYKKKITKIGPGVELPAYDAFVFSLITGAGYLENKTYPYTPKGHFKIFNNALSYKMVTGLFENYSLRTTPYYLNESRPFLFNGNKTIIPVEFNNEKELRNKLDKICKESNTDIIILRVETNKKGNGLESFLEYLACRYFNKKGYITENQIPLFPTVGSPDFGGFNISNEFLFAEGFNIVELSLMRVFPKKIASSFSSKTVNFIVGEAKTSTLNISSQLEKYTDTGLFNEGIEILPVKPKNSLNAKIYINDNNKLVYEPSKEKFLINVSEQKSYYKWLKHYFSLYTIANLSNDEMLEYYLYKMSKSIDRGEDIISLVSSFEPHEIIKDIFNFIHNGSFK